MGIFNIIWFVFVGCWQALIFLCLAIIFASTIIGIPIAKSLLEFAKLSAFPFGKEVIRETELKGEQNVSAIRKVGGIIINILWLPFGLVLSMIFILSGIIAFITIVFIPVGVVYVRMSKFLLWPLGAKVVTQKQAYASAVANEIEKRNR